MSFVQVKDITLKAGGKEIVSGIGLSLDAGQLLVIVGPNGAGKTTLIKAIAGLIQSAAGEVSIAGKPLAAYSRRELAQTVAVVSQDIPTDFPYSVTETVMLGRFPYLGLLGIEGDKDRAVAAQAMAAADVKIFADRPYAQLSGGERQRVMIARALCQEPRLILLDEPTASLDPAHQLRIMTVLQELRQQRGITVVMVSHDLNLAALHADLLLLMKKGRMVALGTPAEVLREEVLREVYDCPMLVDTHPQRPVPRITLTAL